MLCLSILFYKLLIGSGSVIDSLVAAFISLASDFAQLDTSIYAAHYSQDTDTQNKNTSSEYSQSRNYQDIAHAFALIPHPLLPALILPSLRDDVTAEENFINIQAPEIIIMLTYREVRTTIFPIREGFQLHFMPILYYT